MDTLGIDIGTATVKYVRYRKRTDAIVSRGEYRYRRGWEELRDILSAIKDREGVNVSLSVGISSVELIKKIHSVPMQPEAEMRAEVDSLVSKAMLVPLVDMHRQYIMLGEIEERGAAKQDVLFLGAHRSFVDHAVALFHKSGFKRLNLLTDVGFCYQFVVDHAFNGAVAVVDVGGRQTGIYIIDSGKLLLTRELMTACEAFKDAIVGGLALSPNEAEERLWMNGFVDTFEETLTLPLERLAAQIQRTFLIFSQKYPKRPIFKVWIAGRGSRIPGLPEKLNQLLAEEFDILPSRAEVEQEYVPAYALATRSDKFPNLLPEEITGLARQAAVTRYAKAAGILIVSAIALLSLVTWTRFYYLKATLDSRLSVLSQKKQQLTGYSSTQQPGPGRAQMSFKAVQQRDASFVLLLKYLSSHLPPPVYLKSVEFNAASTTSKTANDTEIKVHPGSQKVRATGTMLLRGYIFSEHKDAETILAQVVTNLERSGFLTNVRVAQKEMKSVKDKILMEFMVSGEFRGYEI